MPRLVLLAVLFAGWIAPALAAPALPAPVVSLTAGPPAKTQAGVGRIITQQTDAEGNGTFDVARAQIAIGLTSVGVSASGNFSGGSTPFASSASGSTVLSFSVSGPADVDVPLLLTGYVGAVGTLGFTATTSASVTLAGATWGSGGASVPATTRFAACAGPVTKTCPADVNIIARKIAVGANTVQTLTLAASVDQPARAGQSVGAAGAVVSGLIIDPLWPLAARYKLTVAWK